MPRRRPEVPKSMEKFLVELTAYALLFLMVTLFLVISTSSPAESYSQSLPEGPQLALHMRTPGITVTPFNPPRDTVTPSEGSNGQKLVPSISQILNEYVKYTHPQKAPEHFVYPENIGQYPFKEAIGAFFSIINEYPSLETTIQPEDLQDPKNLAAFFSIQSGEDVLDKVRLQLGIPYNETNTYGMWDQVYIIIIKNQQQEVVLLRADNINWAGEQANLVHPGDTVFAFRAASYVDTSRDASDPDSAAVAATYKLTQLYEIPPQNVWLYVVPR